MENAQWIPDIYGIVLLVWGERCRHDLVMRDNGEKGNTVIIAF